MIPTSIDGTDITGATIDGTDVQEITVDGDTVFTAETLPVAYSDLLAWWPFDSSQYGGSDADDVTALFNPGDSGDSTAYHGTVSGATYQSSGGVTDINAGANSGAFDFDGSNDGIEIGKQNILGGKSQCTFCAWIKPDSVGPFRAIMDNWWDGSEGAWRFNLDGNQLLARISGSSGASSTDVSGGSITTGVFQHVLCRWDGNTGDMEIFIDGTQVASGTETGTINNNNNPMYIGRMDNGGGGNFTAEFDGIIEDCRIYDAFLSTSQISDIISNTQP